MATCERAAALASLAAAFDGVRLEDGISLREADVMDDYGSDEERAAARALDTAIDWRDVPVQDLERFYWAWSYFDAKGFRFYLAAVLAWWLDADRRPDADSGAIDAAISSLKDRGRFRKLYEEKVRLLSDHQIQAVCECLTWIACNDSDLQKEALRAIKSLERLPGWRLTQLH